MSNHEDDLDLLLSLERVLDTPPGSPSAHHSQSPDPGSPTRVFSNGGDMSVFKNVVGEYLEDVPTKPAQAPNPSKSKPPKDVDVEKFSGLRIRNQALSKEELNDHFADIRFIRLAAIRNSLVGGTVSGCWATAGVLTEKGKPRVSSNGKNYCIWKIGCLDENIFSVFLFGDAYSKNTNEKVGTVFALFNAGIRKDAEGNGFSLSVFQANQIVKMGTSIDYGVCKGKKKDGTACTMGINKRSGIYCKYHISINSQKYSVTTRAELKGGNLRTAFRAPYQPEGIYMVDRNNIQKSKQPMKVMSVDGLKKALSKAGKVTTNTHSQGIRFLTEVTGKMHAKEPSKGSAMSNSNQQKGSTEKRLSSAAMKLASTMVINNQPKAKRKKTEKATEKMIELDVYSDEE